MTRKVSITQPQDNGSRGATCVVCGSQPLQIRRIAKYRNSGDFAQTAALCENCAHVVISLRRILSVEVGK